MYQGKSVHVSINIVLLINQYLACHACFLFRWRSFILSLIGFVWSVDRTSAFHIFDHGALDTIFQKVTLCSNVHVNLNSCLMQGALETIPMFLSKDVIDMSLNSKCRPPDIDDNMIHNMFLQAQAGCSLRGIQFDSKDVATESAIMKKILSKEECWLKTCNEISGGVNDLVQTGLTNAHDTIVDRVSDVIDAVAQCSGVQIHSASCITNTAINMIINEAIGGDEGNTSNRQLNVISAFTSDNNNICTPPDIELSEIKTFVKAAEEVCNSNGDGSGSAGNLSLALNKLFTAESCWMSLCNQVNDQVTKVIETIPIMINQGLFDTVGQCTGITIDPTSCLANAARDILMEQILAGADFNIDLPQIDPFTIGTFLSNDMNVCPAPDVDSSEIKKFVEQANQRCLSRGITTQNESLSDFSLAFSKLLSNESCWFSMCRGIQTKLKGFLEQSFKLKQMSLDYVTRCASVDFSLNSCIEISIVDMILSEHQINFDSISGNVTETNYESFIDEFGNEIKQHNNLSFVKRDQCPIPHIDPSELDDIITKAAKKCNNQGENVSQHEEDTVKAKMSILFDSDQCWESLCSPDSFLTVTSSSVEQCLNIDLPVSMTNPAKVLENPQRYLDDSRLACMINYAITKIDKSDFKIGTSYDEKSLQCLPPGFYDIRNICPTLIGPEAMSQCPPPNRPMFDDDFWSGGGTSLSFSYDYLSFSFSYEFPETSFLFDFSYNYEKDIDRLLVKQLCDVLEAMSSDEGQTCLLPLCNILDGDFGFIFDTTNVSNVPSILPSTVPTEKPSISPTTEPTSNPTSKPSMIPTSRPTNAPSILPTTTPSIIPSLEPSSSPTYLPTVQASLSPSVSPSTTPEVGNVEIKFEAAITLDMSIDDIPKEGPELTKIVNVLAQSINRFLPVGATARIISIGGISVARRKLRSLQEGLKIEFEVIMKKQCSSASCEGSIEVAKSMYSEVTSNFEIAVTNGSLTTEIQKKASTQDIPVLKAIAVSKNSFEAKEATVKVETLNVTNDDEPTKSSGTRWQKSRYYISAIAAISLIHILQLFVDND